MADPGSWRLDDAGPVVVARCATLDACPGVGHAFSTLRGPGGPVDAGPAVPDASQRAGRAAVARAAGLAPESVRALRQVHGDRVVDAAAVAPGDPPEADGVLARTGSRVPLSPAVRTADCVPVLLADRTGRTVAAVHAGWRGAAAGIAARAVAALAAVGTPAATLVAAVGPAAGPCCYEVSADVAAAVARGCRVPEASIARGGRRAGRPVLDLPGAVRGALIAAGLPAAAVSVAPWCTICAPGLFHSFRRDGDRAGRSLAVVGRIGLP